MSDIEDRMRALGLEFTPAQIAGSIALFSPLLPPVDETRVLRDRAYGPDPRNRLDLFLHGEKGARPVLVFIHGGGFIRGDKGNAGDPFYNNFGAWAARSGYLGATATYRLAPDHPWPAGAEDVAATVRWLKANAAAHGGDPDRIVLVGQSAGAAHVASYVGCAPFAAEAARTVVAAVLMSGVYDLVRGDHSPYEQAYYGTDESRFAAQSSVEGLAASPVPCLVTLSENDPPVFQRQAAFLVERWVAARSQWPTFAQLSGHNHITPVHMIGTSVDGVGPLIARFVERTLAR